MGFASVEEIETRAKEQECQLWETILHDDMTERQVDRLESIGKMSSMYLAMKDANESYDKDLKSQSGLSGGDGEKMMEEVRKMQNLTGEFVGTVMANALKMGESNACMKRIVAAPTAGACGVLPAVLITYEQFHKVPEAKMLEGMYIAAGVGQVIADVPVSQGHKEDVRQRSVLPPVWQQQLLRTFVAVAQSRSLMQEHLP